MLTPRELHRLLDELAHRRVLSVYLDTRVTDPAMRDAWRPTLQAGLREARARITDAAERAHFDRAAASLHDPFPAPGGLWGAPGWVAFVTAEGRRYVAELPVRPTTLVAWRDGPVIAPYLRALKQHRPVIVGLVDSRSARLHRYAQGELELVEELSVPREEPAGVERLTGPAASAISAPVARGAVGTDVAQRRRRAAFERLAASLATRIGQLAGTAGWVLIGGTPEWARLAGAALPRHLDGRALVSATLDHDAPADEIARAAKRAATQLRGEHGRRLLGQLLDRAGGHGRAAVGVPAVQRALRTHAVDLLLLSPGFIHAHERDAEDLVRAALAGGADVEVPSGHAAEQLDRVTDGIAARLRFAIEEPGLPREHAPRPRFAPSRPTLQRAGAGVDARGGSG
ncbi:MAG TPA: hypothetical protein VFS08_15250 [Gemmatimonadaceae bacterium]|nr:hypothetical protein [Gemmatimonadaceae bacterium]